MQSLFRKSRARSVLSPGRRAAARGALTLIEMLVAVTITLMVILAIVQVFDLLGTNIKTGQALIEVTTDLRFISQQLQDDLDGLTCPARTWIDPASGQGGLEIYDGPSCDRDWNAVFDEKNSVDAFDIAAGEDSSMGDVDDYLWLTTRNIETPFSGRVPARDPVDDTEIVQYIESKDAEVTWWTAVVRTNVTPGEPLPTDRDAVLAPALEPTTSGRLSPTSSVALFRHAGLIVPGIDLSPLETTTRGRAAQTLQDVLNFLDTFDVSVRWIDSDGDGIRDQLMPNSLGDLTQRQNRFMRFAYRNDAGLQPAQTNAPSTPAAEISAAAGGGGFPFPLANVTSISPVTTLNSSYLPRNTEINAYNQALALDTTNPNAQAQLRNNLTVERPRFARYPYSVSIFALSGETVDTYQFYSALMARSLVSDNIHAFDIRVYDPNAPVFTEVNQPNVAIAPGDPGYPVNELDRNSRLANGATGLILRGIGAYVDLQYADVLQNVGDGRMITSVDTDGDGAIDVTHTSLFSVIPPTNSLGVTRSAMVGWWPFYDTWSIDYERDGINQGGLATIDEGTNDVDDDDQEGIDDYGERETGPILSYDTPLRGIKVSIRKMDRETRQLRQTSVVGDFVPE